MTEVIVEADAQRASTTPLVAIGASAGGIEPLTTVVGSLPHDLPACVLVVVHVPSSAESALPRVLARACDLPAAHATDGEPLTAGRILVAPPDHHLTVRRGVAQVRRGPTVNRSRPAIDPLFQSIALERTAGIGVILSGALDDGAAGLAEIARAGGAAIVQDPDEAAYPSMALAALERTPDAAALPAAEIGPRIVDTLHTLGAVADSPMRKGLEQELMMTELEPGSPTTDDVVSRTSAFGCPSCGGTLWELDEAANLRFRCRVGHAFSPQTLFEAQGAAVEDGLWMAIRALEEQSSLARRLAATARGRSDSRVHARFSEQADEAERHAEAIRGVLRLEAGSSPVATDAGHARSPAQP